MAKKVKVDKLKWGKIQVGDKEYHDILIYGDTVEAREYERLKELFGTGHKIGNWEVEKLFSNDPEIIIIGIGWAGLVKVPPIFEKEAGHRGIEIKILKSKKAVKEFNKLVSKGKRVNVLIHSTC